MASSLHTGALAATIEVVSINGNFISGLGPGIFICRSDGVPDLTAVSRPIYDLDRLVLSSSELFTAGGPLSRGERL